MSYEGKHLAKARERLAKLREDNAALRMRREAEVYARAPEVRETDKALRELLLEVVHAASGPSFRTEMARIDERSLALCQRKTEQLVARGWPPDYLDDIYCCPRCRDSGYLRDGRMCTCLKELYEAERKAELNAALALSAENFADFRLDYYTGEARECMELTLNTAQAYAAGFGPDSPNLLFQGGTGLGKTFLSGCIAKTVSARGFSVVYETAQRAFGAFEEQKFSREADTYAQASEKVKRILCCDLLILDDLGTELTTSFTQSALYNIINSRLSESGTKTVISTNLSDSEFAARYIPQIVSRVNGEYDILLFMGRDIRAIRREQRYR